MQVLNIDSFFQCIAAKHVNIESYGNGDRWEIAVAGDDNYPRLWLQQIFQNNVRKNGVVSWRVTFLIMKISNRDEKTELADLDETHTIALEIIEFIKQSSKYALGEFADLVSFTEAFDDSVVGWAVELDLIERNAVDRCNLDEIFLAICDYQILNFPLSNLGLAFAGKIDGLTINGAFNAFGGAYLVADATIGADEFQRLVNDLTAAGYTVESNYTGVTFSLIFRETQDVIEVLNYTEVPFRLPPVSRMEPFVVLNCSMLE